MLFQGLGFVLRLKSPFSQEGCHSARHHAKYRKHGTAKNKGFSPDRSLSCQEGRVSQRSPSVPRHRLIPRIESHCPLEHSLSKKHRIAMILRPTINCPPKPTHCHVHKSGILLATKNRSINIGQPVGHLGPQAKPADIYHITYA